MGTRSGPPPLPLARWPEPSGRPPGRPAPSPQAPPVSGWRAPAVLLPLAVAIGLSTSAIALWLLFMILGMGFLVYQGEARDWITWVIRWYPALVLLGAALGFATAPWAGRPPASRPRALLPAALAIAPLVLGLAAAVRWS